MKALSVRGPWWWFILHAGKRYENREWSDAYARAQLSLCPPGTEFLLHAGSGLTRGEYDAAVTFARETAEVTQAIPDYEALPRGGFVGLLRHEGLVRGAASSWFTGPLALKLVDPYPLPFAKGPGALGFFEAGAPFG